MLGTLRLVLAYLVVIAHLRDPAWYGMFAVFGFFVISGYLMTLLLNQRYGFSPRGLLHYTGDRLLRIYPPYWVACILSAVLILAFGEPAARAFYQDWRLPDLASWYANLSIFGLGSHYGGNRLVPPSWALRVELAYYAMMALGLSRGRVTALVWLFVAAGYHVYLHVTDASLFDRYFTIAAGGLPFALGACIHHHRDLLERIPQPGRWLVLAMAIWMGNGVVLELSDDLFSYRAYYLNCFLAALAVALISVAGRGGARLQRADHWLGDLSYPVYLLHMQVGFLMIQFVDVERRSWELVAISTPLLFLLSWAMRAYINLSKSEDPAGTL